MSPSRGDRSSRSHSSADEFEMDVTEVNMCSEEERRLGGFRERVACKHSVASVLTVCVFWLSPVWFLDYKNNLLKERVHMNAQPKVIDLDKGKSHTCSVSYQEWSHVWILPNLNLSLLLAEMQKFSKWENDRKREIGSHWLVQRLCFKQNTHCLLSWQERRQREEMCRQNALLGNSEKQEKKKKQQHIFNLCFQNASVTDIHTKRFHFLLLYF